MSIKKTANTTLTVLGTLAVVFLIIVGGSALALTIVGLVTYQVMDR